MCARRLSRFAEVAQECWRQHVLDQRGLARAADAGDTHQSLQWNVDRNVFEVVLGYAFQNQARRVLGHHALEAHADLFAPAQVSAGQRIRAAQVLRTAIKHNLAALLAGAGAHINHAVRSQHDGRVMLHHHQCVARIAQALHGNDDAVHVPGVQADAGFIQHKQRVNQ